jgi:hypothetical protein
VNGRSWLLVLGLSWPASAWAQEPPPPPAEAAQSGEATPPEPVPPVEQAPPAEEPAAAPVTPDPPAASQPALPPLDLPVIDPETLAMGSTFGISAGTFRWTSSGQAVYGKPVRDERTTVSFGLEFRYFRGLEMPRFGWSLELTGNESFLREPGSSVPGTTTNRLGISVLPEGRYYLYNDKPFFVHATAALHLTVDAERRDEASTEVGPNSPTSLAGSIGVGAGRILGIDPVVRLRRREAALQEDGALAGPLSGEVGADIIRTWYALRNDFGQYRMHAYTMQAMETKGALLAAPSRRATYRVLQVLADPFIVGRRTGWEARVGLGVFRSFVDEGGMGDPDNDPAPSFGLLASGQREWPIGTKRQLSLRGKAAYELGATGDSTDFTTQPTPRFYQARGFATYTRVFYGDAGDPLGAVTLAGELGLAGERSPANLLVEPKTSLDIVGTVALSRAFDRGSSVTLSGSGALRNDGVYTLTIDLGFTWGVASGLYTLYAVPAALR